MERQPKKESPDEYMREALSDVSEGTLQEWLSKENLADKETRTVEGFEVTASIDGNAIPNREVSLVKITGKNEYPQHVHDDSDAYFVMVEGDAQLLSGKNRKAVKPGDAIKIPRGMKHGFYLEKESHLVFVSIQSPPILDPDTGKEDLRLIDIV